MLQYDLSYKEQPKDLGIYQVAWDDYMPHAEFVCILTSVL